MLIFHLLKTRAVYRIFLLQRLPEARGDLDHKHPTGVAEMVRLQVQMRRGKLLQRPFRGSSPMRYAL